MGVAAVLAGELALAQGVVHAGVGLEVVGVSALASHRAVVVVVELLAGVLVGLGADDLAPQAVGKMAVEPVLAVPREVMDAGVEAAVDVLLGALLRSGALLHGEVLVSAVAADRLEFSLELLELQEFFVVHSTLIIFLSNQLQVINKIINKCQDLLIDI